ncbi:hypothetical protein GCK32_012933 [Trichostrongylus colubriformis]|uniref:Uncharacterized protein n=1 Tax=Trichostrongylus colubriformis TaxID=6319 RepID=A0AAN8FZK2_TRICO
MFLTTTALVATYVFLSPSSASPEGQSVSFTNLRPWIEAVIFSICLPQLGFGGMVFLGSQSDFFNDVVSDAMTITVLTTILFAIQGCIYAVSVDTFLVEVSEGDSYSFHYTNVIKTDYSIKGNRASTYILSVFLSSMHIFGDLQIPLTFILSITGFLASALTKLFTILFIRDETTNFDRIDSVFFLLILSPIPICAINRIWYFYSNRMDWRRLFRPDAELWGPRSTAHRRLAEKNEKLARIY